jgi:branched-chain amino acid transport system substrate-binding protein
VASRVSAVHEAGAYGDGLFATFAERFTALGGTVASVRSYATAAEATDAIIAAAAPALAVDEVLFIGQTPDAIAFLDVIGTSALYDGLRVFVTDTAANNDFVTRADSARFPYLRGTRPSPLSETDLVYATFFAAYRLAFDEDPRGYSFVAHAYDAAWLVLYGAVWSLSQEGSVTGPGIAVGITKQSDKQGGPAFNLQASAWQDVVASLSAGQGVDVHGASGSLDFDSATGETAGNVDLWAVDSAKALHVLGVWEPGGAWLEPTPTPTCP